MIKKNKITQFVVLTCILSILFILNPSNSIAKETKKSQIEQGEIVELMTSLKDSIGSLNNRLSDIENKLKKIDEKNDTNTNSVNNKWTSFSSAKNNKDSDSPKTVSTNDKTDSNSGSNKSNTNIKNEIIKAITVKKELEQGYSVGCVYIGTEKVIAYKSAAGGFTPYERAQSVADKIKQHINTGGDFQNLKPVKRNGMFIGDLNGDTLFTVDTQTAKKYKMNPESLTINWVNNVRDAFGVPKVKRLAYLNTSRSLSASGRSQIYRSRNSAIIETLLPISPYSFSNVHFGGASWYGGFFNGRRSADGSRFNMNEMTAAHKSLPFGTIVKVTNLRNQKSCLVRITDRGPYIHGRIIDLSKAAAQEVGMLSSGTAHVKVEIIGKPNKKI